MAIFKCKMCGGTIEFEQRATVGVCDSCGTKQTLPRLDDDRLANLYDRANHFRRNNEYDKAAGIYEQILSEDTTDAEVYWSLVLCRYGIEYVEDPTTHKRVPTVNRAQFTSIFDDDNYRSALQYADAYQRELYENEAKAINDIQKGILAISQKEEPFDVFICYKETDTTGQRTQDSVLANDLYHQLTNEGFKVFFARITLEDKLGTAYEPYIFAALNSAKVMVVIGTKPEHFNAVWVKNEWSRYLALVKKSDGKKVLIPAYRDMDPYDLPEEFSHLQAQDMSKLGFMQDLIRGIKKILDSADSDAKKQSGSSAAKTDSFDIDKILKRAFLFIEDEKDDKADELLEKVIDADPQNVKAYIGKLLLEAGVQTEDKLVETDIIIFDSKNLDRAIRFADNDLKQKLTEIKFENAYRVGRMRYEKAIADSDFEFAKVAFEKVPEYKDSAAMIEQCTQKGQSAKTARIYTDALSLFNNANSMSNGSIEKLNKAITKFESVIDYEDSKKRIDECKHRIEEIRASIKANKKKAGKIAIIACVAIAVIIAFIIVLKAVIIPASKYSNAVAMMNSGDFDNAIDAFEAMDGYKDSEEKITECIYKKAEAYFKDGKYKEASEIYDKISNYSDAKEKYRESIYQMALAYYNDKDYDRSNPMFEEIKDYKDSADKIHYHDWKITKTIDATCTDNGSISYECSCGETKTVEIAALGHDWKDATCTEPTTCTRCNVTSGSALGHTNTAKCERCGKVLFETLQFSNRGDDIFTDIQLPEGKFKISMTSELDATEVSDLIFVYLYDAEDNRVVLISGHPTKFNGFSDSDQTTFDGPVTGGRIEVETENSISWTITIEAM